MNNQIPAALLQCRVLGLHAEIFVPALRVSDAIIGEWIFCIIFALDTQ